MTTPNRKTVRLIEKLRSLKTSMMTVKAAPKGSSVPGSTDHDPDAIYVSRETLIELLEERLASSPFQNYTRRSLP